MARLLYIVKRARFECLVAVAFLTKRAHNVDEDVRGKLKCVFGFSRATLSSRIVFRVGTA